MITMLRPSGRTPLRIAATSCASLYLPKDTVRFGAVTRAIIGSSNITVPSACLPWQAPTHPRIIASRPPSAMDAGSVAMGTDVTGIGYVRLSTRSDATYTMV